VLAVERFFDLPTGPRGLAACDSLGGLNKSQEHQKKIRPGAKHADILRRLHQVHAAFKGTLQYEHVYGHQDKHKTWRQMTLLERHYNRVLVQYSDYNNSYRNTVSWNTVGL
jgi:hypothetical protein